MIKGIRHGGILVKNLDEYINLYCCLLGLEKPAEVKEWPKERMRNVIIMVRDQSIEVREALPGSGLAKFIEHRGEGLHHLCLYVTDLEKMIKSLQQKGVVILERTPKVTFIHPKSTKGVLFELRESE